MSIDSKILAYLEANSGAMAKEMASSLGVPRKEVNSRLYGALKDKVKKGDGFSWSLSCAAGSDVSIPPSLVGDVVIDSIQERGGAFFSVSTDANAVVLKLNKNHTFYKNIYTALVDGSEVKRVVDLLLESYARMQIENYDLVSELEDCNERWGSYLSALSSSAK